MFFCQFCLLGNCIVINEVISQSTASACELISYTSAYDWQSIILELKYYDILQVHIFILFQIPTLLFYVIWSLCCTGLFDNSNTTEVLFQCMVCACKILR